MTLGATVPGQLAGTRKSSERRFPAMRRVSIQKVTNDETNTFVCLGKPHEGLEQVKPSVGKPYYIYDNSGQVLKTSAVIKVMDGFFETQNSYYKLTVLENEPFDLLGEDEPESTQKLVLSKLAQTRR
jgi:hypothetical protein